MGNNYPNKWKTWNINFKKYYFPGRNLRNQHRKILPVPPPTAQGPNPMIKMSPPRLQLTLAIIVRVFNVTHTRILHKHSIFKLIPPEARPRRHAPLLRSRTGKDCGRNICIWFCAGYRVSLRGDFYFRSPPASSSPGPPSTSGCPGPGPRSSTRSTRGKIIQNLLSATLKCLLEFLNCSWCPCAIVLQIQYEMKKKLFDLFQEVLPQKHFF